ncbi:uncharacterized protein BDCG_08149 [Blastomyces dermatitidis ER-3]|uniref:Uncharacterized protein n=1 Tax=Ajellomyces dermatitidis (strain ER-3 / ATCC MYA-2586) TaxID=559297 RepID=A0ABP2EN92_AJEDR|nr:uncharacterized protein BDCG_08149 [Blastomyces dermatitidis ER-3]EEQ84880.1 hypothetical protein BDCG_08149 [Blastomyces dermatitidis ER-3]
MLIRDCTEAFSQREDEETVRFCRLNSAASQAGLRCVREKLQIELLEVTVSEIKLFLSFSLNDHTGLYITVLAERGGSVATAVKRAEDRLNADASTDRTAAAVREAEEGVTMKVILPQLIDIIIFNLAFLTVMKAAATS